MLAIDYDSEGFSAGAPVTNGAAALATGWDDLLKAALTVGRPSWQYVFRFGPASFFEAIFRLSLVRMALEQSGPAGRRFRRTAAARTMDPTEKGAISYFLGLTVAKLFAARLLTADWMLHLDVFRPATTRMLAGRSRPDLVGQMANGNWVVLEAKGRISEPDAGAKGKAKQQAQRVISIDGSRPAYQIGAITFFRRDTLSFYWNDPEPESGSEGLAIDIRPSDWRHYYGPTFALIASRPEVLRRMQAESVMARVESADVSVGIRPDVLRVISESRWDALAELRRSLTGPDEHSVDGQRYGADGIAVIAGDSWHGKFNEELFLSRSIVGPDTPMQ